MGKIVSVLIGLKEKGKSPTTIFKKREKLAKTMLDNHTVNMNDEDKKKKEEEIKKTIDAAYTHVFSDTYLMYKEQEKKEIATTTKTPEEITPDDIATQQRFPSDH